MDEIEALNAEWLKIQSKGSAVMEGELRCGSSSSSDATSSGQRRKRSRWSDDKISIDGPSNSFVYDSNGPVVTSFTDCVSKLVEERRQFEAANDLSGRSLTTIGDLDLEMSPTTQVSDPPSFRQRESDEKDASSSHWGRSTRKRKYRDTRAESSSESDTKSPVVRFPSHPSSEETEQINQESNSICPEPNTTGTNKIPENVGTFLEKKTMVIVKNLTDWITPSHILQDVKSAQLRSFEDSGIVRKRERGAPYRYAYVNFLTHTSARRWIDIRKGRLVVGSQQFQMELSLRDWKCPECQVFNFGKSVVCCRCRKAKAQLLKTSMLFS